MKICNSCKISKPNTDFCKNKRNEDGFNKTCKKCAHNSYLKHREKRTREAKIYRSKNLRSIKSKRKIYYENNKDKLISYAKEYRDKNKQEIYRKNKLYRDRNKEKLKLRRDDYVKNRLRVDTNFKLIYRLRRRIRNAIKGYSKSKKTADLLGCNLTNLKNYLQRTAINNGYLDFDIENYNAKEYHIDHIIPCNSFYLACSYHQKLCFNWSNLQILKAEDNLKKNKYKEIL